MLKNARTLMVTLALGPLPYFLALSILAYLQGLLTGWRPEASWVLTLSLLAHLGAWRLGQRGPELRRISVPIADLPQELEGFTIAQISNLRVGPHVSKRYVTNVVERINSLGADLVALTGNVGGGPASQFRHEASPLARLRPRLGTFFVPGECEYFWGGNEWLTVINNFGIVNLVNRGKVVNSGTAAVLVAGVADPASGLSVDVVEVVAMAHGELTPLKILLSHRPTIAEDASRAGFHLQLSNRSFRAQIIPKLSTSSLYRVDGLWLHLARAAGLRGSFLRLYTTPELTHLTLVRSRTKDSLRPAQSMEII